MAKFNLAEIQKALSATSRDGWLFYDYRGMDPIGKKILNLSDEVPNTRRWFYYIPASGVPVKIVNTIERMVLDHLPGKKQVYLGWREMESALNGLFSEGDRVAVQYSARGANPYVSRMDAGTFELLKGMRVKLESSADLLQLFEARWTEAQLNTHKNSAKQVYELVEKAFRLIRRNIKAHREVTEYSVQKFLVSEMNKRGMVYQLPPIVASGKNTGNPHYLPSEHIHQPVYPGSLVQLNVWAKENSANAVYAVIAWVGYVGNEVPPEMAEKFALICEARDQAIAFVDHAIKNDKAIHGWQVDDVARNYLSDAGYSSYFLHRTGHSIGREINDTGVNIDNLETRDERQIIPNICFSIEPALYFPDYGMRSEVNVYVDKKGAHVYTLPVQKEIVPILK